MGSIQILFPSNTSTGSGRHISLHMRIVLKSSKFNIFFNEGCAVHQVVWYIFHLSDVATQLCFQIITKDKKYEFYKVFMIFRHITVATFFSRIFCFTSFNKIYPNKILTQIIKI